MTFTSHLPLNIIVIGCDKIRHGMLPRFTDPRNIANNIAGIGWPSSCTKSVQTTKRRRSMERASSTIVRSAQFAMSLVVFLVCSRADSMEFKSTTVTPRVGVGAEITPSMGMFGFMPVPISTTLKLDIGRFLRLHGEYTYHILYYEYRRGSAGAGAAFTVYGKTAPTKGGGEIKIPALFEFGGISGRLDVGDGHVDAIKWLIMGPSTGIDYTWWFPKKVGIWICLNISYMFRVDRESEYSGYDDLERAIGFPEIAVLVGFAI